MKHISEGDQTEAVEATCLLLFPSICSPALTQIIRTLSCLAWGPRIAINNSNSNSNDDDDHHHHGAPCYCCCVTEYLHPKSAGVSLQLRCQSLVRPIKFSRRASTAFLPPGAVTTSGYGPRQARPGQAWKRRTVELTNWNYSPAWRVLIGIQFHFQVETVCHQCLSDAIKTTHSTPPKEVLRVGVPNSGS